MIVTNEIVCAYPHLSKPGRAVINGVETGEAKYSIEIRIPKKDKKVCEELESSIKSLISENWPSLETYFENASLEKMAKNKKIGICITDGDEVADMDEKYADKKGCWILSAKEPGDRPAPPCYQLVEKGGKKVAVKVASSNVEETIYPGCCVKVAFKPYATLKYNKIAYGLSAVVKTADGTRIGGAGVVNASAFGYEEADEEVKDKEDIDDIFDEEEPPF